MPEEIKEVLLSEEEIKAKVKELGAQITKDYAGKEILLIGILRGVIIFMADLARNIDLPVTLDFMVVSSYGRSTVSSGSVKIVKDLEESIEDKHVLIVEDIIDSGLTLKYLLDNLRMRKPASIRVATLLSKPARRKSDIEVDYNGFVIPDEFIVGYGLDYANKYRNLPYIGILKPEAYKNS